MKSKVFLSKADRSSPLPVVRKLLAQCGIQDWARPGCRVVVKPNLCTERKEQIHTANTSLGVLRAVCETLRDFTHDVTVVESDGTRYSAEAAFENNGVYKMAEELGIRVQNLSKAELVENVSDSRLKGFGLAQCWLDADVFITLPVLKTHATTVFTGSLKNQWGCIPRFDRILLHKHLHELIAVISHLRPVTLALMDGLVGMQGRGPINGYPIDLNVLLASRDPVALDSTAMRLVGLDPFAARHLAEAQKLGVGRMEEEQIDVVGAFEQIQTKVEPAIEDWAIKTLNIISRSKLMTKYLLLNDGLFYPARKAVNIARGLIKSKAKAANTVGG